MVSLINRFALKVNYEHFGERNKVPLLEIGILALVVVLGYCYFLGAVKLYLPRGPYGNELHQWGVLKTLTVASSAIVWPASWLVLSLYRLKPA